MRKISYDDIVNHIDISEGDILEISSDIRWMMIDCRREGVPFDPGRLIESIQKKVTDQGTILVRTWNWDFCRGIPFDCHNTLSQVGSLGNYALKHPGFRRSRHPLYSFAVWGKHRDCLCEVDNISAWGKDSPFGFLTENGGKQFMLGATVGNSLTYVHYVEEQTGVHYRYLKNFTGKYIEADGTESVRTYAMYVRDLALDVAGCTHKIEPLFLEKGAMKSYQFGKMPVSILDLKSAYAIIEDDILHNRSRSFCTYSGQ